MGSNHVADKVGNNNADGILNFLRGHVFTHEEFFAAYKYNNTHYFCDYSNTPLEGTNGGSKYCNQDEPCSLLATPCIVAMTFSPLFLPFLTL